MFTRLFYYGTAQLHLGSEDVWLMPFGFLLDLWECHTGSNVKKSFKGLGKYNLTLEYDVEDTEQHFIYLKYRKDGSTNVGKDCMQFRVRFE